MDKGRWNNRAGLLKEAALMSALDTLIMNHCIAKSCVIPLITGEIKLNKSEVEECTFRNYNQEPAEPTRFFGMLTCRRLVVVALTEAKDNGKD